MTRNIILLISTMLLTVANFPATAQEEEIPDGWHNGGVISLNMSQNSFTNWAAGGQNSVALNGLLSLTANYKKDKSTWDNALTIGYGKMLQKGNDLGWVKTDDRIDLQSKYGRKASGKWFYSGLLSFKTQLDKGYNYPDTENKIGRAHV